MKNMKVKRISAKGATACVLALSLVLTLAGCGSRGAGGSGVLPPMAPPEYPVIDGSSSTVTMHAAIRAYLTDAYFTPEHSQTYAALDRLIPGSESPADVVLAVKYYDDTLREAESRGAELVITPVAKEGFVFILHQDNPVDRLTQKQLRDIYSGRITNWKEVGGRDEEIKLFTRNMDSGSQTAMEEFMGGAALPEGDYVAGSMGDMLYSVTETGSAAIGYNIYSWSMGQGLDGLKLKTAAVDGVAPSNGTLADGSYPLLVYTYSYYNEGNAKGKGLTDWLLTAEGQGVVASAGYVGLFGELPPEEPIDFNQDEWDSTEVLLDFYEQNGWDPGTIKPLELIGDKAQIEALSGGKGGPVTAVWVCSCLAGGEQYLRFIVLTRERGGRFEVIGEGEVAEYNNGVITPGGTQSHQPPGA